MRSPAAKISLSFVLAVAAFAVVATPAVGATARGAAAPPGGYAYQVNAWGSRVSLNGAVTSAPSAQVTFPCPATADMHQTNDLPGLDLAPLLNVKQIKTSGDTSSDLIESVGMADTQGIDLLKGLVTADAAHSVSTTVQTDSGIQSSAEGSFFANLQIAGTPIGDKVKPNTRVDLKGFGYVTLNEQTGRTGSNYSWLSVNGLHLVIDQVNALDIPIGTSVVVADATSTLAGPAVGSVGGNASGSRVQLGKEVVSGASFPVPLPCYGTDGKVLLNGGDGVSVPGILEARVIATSALGAMDQTSASSETTSTVESADLLQELVVAKGIHADAIASTDGSKVVLTDGKSAFGSLSVAGFPKIDANVAPNTRVVIPDLGTLYLHRVIQTSTSIEVRMVELIVTRPNKLGVPIGSDIRVSDARAAARPLVLGCRGRC